MHSCLSEFNEEAFRKGMKEEGYEEGFLDAVLKSIRMFQDNNASKDAAILQIVKYFDLSEQEATTLVNEHWE